MESRILKDIIVEQQRQFEGIEGTVPRTILAKIEPLVTLPHMLVISGLRRAGKSTLLKQIRNRFYPDEPVFYFNFEDERLLHFSADDFNLLHECFLEILGKTRVYLLDEIQNIPGWELFARRMHDAGWKLFITGSNATMLSRELGTRLTGRYIGVELFPFSFGEFLRWKRFEFPPHLSTEDRAEIKRALAEYLKNGGIPEYVIYRDANIIKMLYENILYRDIMVRYKLGDERPLRELALYVMSNPGTEISYQRLTSMVSLGSVNTVKNYIQYMENAFLIFTIYKYDYSVGRQVRAAKKIYASDTGFISQVAFRQPKFMGKVLENLILVEIKRRGSQVFFHKEKHECDFLVVEDDQVREAIQVTTLLAPAKEREFTGLIEAMDIYGLNEGTIITEDEEFEELVGGKTVRVIPAWKWLMGLNSR